MRASVIQGTFPHGITHLRHHRVVQPRVTQPHAAPRTPAPRVAAPPVPNAATAVALPPHLAHISAQGGQPLPPAVRQAMESVFGTSFADVRVHIGREATAIGATAFTTGTQIHFAPGAYNPATPAGQRTLAHELAHVVQQRSGRVRNPFGDGVAVVHDHTLEAEADRFGQRVAQMRPAMPRVVQPMFDDILDEPRRHSDDDALPPVSFKIRSTVGRNFPKLKGDTDLDAAQFGKRGRQVVRIAMHGKVGDHYEILCQVTGIYGKTKYLKFHFTSSGYYAIYHADPNHGALPFVTSAVPLVAANTTDKLYAIFMNVAKRRGHYKKAGNDCQDFANEFYYEATGIQLGDDFM